MTHRSTGLLIAGAFGVLFVLLNAHAPLPQQVAVVLSALALLALVVLIALGVRTGRLPDEPDATDPPPQAMFGTGYKIVLGLEVLALFGGIAVLRLLGLPEEAIVGWVALVVGLHFFGLIPVWRSPSIAVPGVLLTLLGVTGLVMASTSLVAWAPIVSGVLSGYALLGCSLVAILRQLGNRPATPAPDQPA